MDDYAASCSKIEKITSACQRLKECLQCTICIELFNEPVSLKCGHRFCRSCILQVTGNANPSCPLCNIKIQKRSIPKEGCVVIQACINRYKELCQAILSDSGIDVTKSLNKVQSTKESIHERPSTSKVDTTFNTYRDSPSLSSVRTPSSKILSRKNPPSSKKLSATKQKTAAKTNKIDKYFSNCDSEEKVKSWLENLTPDVDSGDKIVTSSEQPVEILSFENQSVTPVSESLNASSVVPNQSSYKSSDLTENSNKKVDEDTGDLSYKETRTILENVETMAKKKKSPSIPENVVLKIPSTIPAAAHPDAQDWRRVKKVGKELQVKTFKSLNLSVEKRCSSPIQDDNEDSCDSIKKTGRAAVLEEFNTNQRSNSKKLGISQFKEKSTKSLGVNKSVDENSNTKDVSKEGSKKSNAGHLPNLQYDENTPELYPDEVHGSEPVVFPINTDNDTPEKTRDVSAVNQPSTSRFNQSSPLKIKMKQNQTNYEELSDLSPQVSVVESSPIKSKPSLKLSLKNTTKSSPVGSSADKTDQLEDKTFQSTSPEKSRSRLSLRLPISKKSEENLNSSTGSVSSCLGNSKPSAIPNHSHVVFKKLGRICKKKKRVPFLYLGRLSLVDNLNDEMSMKQPTSKVLMKSNVPVKVDYKVLKTDTPSESMSSRKNLKILSPGKDSQLKFLASDSLIHSETHVHETNPRCLEDQVEHPSTPMDIDELPLAKRKTLSDASSQQSAQQDLCSDNEIVESENAIDLVPQSKSIEKKSETEIKIQGIESENNSEPKRTTAPSMPEIISLDSSHEIAECQDDAQRIGDDVNLSENQVSEERRPKETEDEAIVSLSSKDEESEEKLDCGNLNKNSERKKSLSSSPSSSPRVTLSKRRRISSESSNDDDHDRLLDEVLGRWGTESEPASKQPKTSSTDCSREINDESSRAQYLKLNKRGLDSPKIVSKPTVAVLEKDSAPAGMISGFRSPKEDAMVAENLVPMPSSLLSADMFESEAQMTPKRMKTRAVITNDHSPNSQWSPSKNSDQGKTDNGQKNSDMTMIDAQQFHNEKYSSPDISNKENEKINRDMMSTPIRKNVDDLDQESEIGNSQNAKIKCHPNKDYECYHVSDSLMDITQEHLARKEIEKDLFGMDLSEIRVEKNAKVAELRKFTTPPRKPKESQINNDLEDDFDSENIGATPVVRRRPKFNFPVPTDGPKSGNYGAPENSETSSPDYLNFSAITPIRSNLHPLNHSTPMMDTSLEVNDSKQIVLVCSCLRPDDIGKVNSFVQKFNAKLQSTFTMEVTHVVFRTDPKTKAGQKTFKYIQGIGFKKYVVGFQWIEDCLKSNTLLDEDDEKYDVLDPDVLVSGTKKARAQPPSLFENFVCLCVEPFESCKVDEFKELLHHNGAIVVPSWEHLDSFKNKFRIIILGSESVDPGVVDEYKKRKTPLVHFEWVVDSLSQYHITSLLSYFCETTADEALEYGIPPEFLIEDETAEDTDIDVE